MKGKLLRIWKRNPPGKVEPSLGNGNSSTPVTSIAISDPNAASVVSPPSVSEHASPLQEPAPESATPNSSNQALDISTSKDKLSSSSYRFLFSLICVESVDEHNEKLVQEALRSFAAVDGDSTTTGNVVASAVEKLNKATALLARIISFLREEWHPDASLRTLDRDNLDISIEVASAEIQKLIDLDDKAKAADEAKTGGFHKLGKAAESICVHLKPFFKTFLAVAIQGSAVKSSPWT